MRINEIINESVHRVPLRPSDINKLKTLLSAPLPIDTAIEQLTGLLEDDGLFDTIRHAKSHTTDAGPIVAEWLKQHVPDMFNDSEFENRLGTLSTISGYPDDIKSD